MSEPAWSPCKRICIVDPARSICVGCFRTLEELERWTRMSRREHMAIKSQLKQRKANHHAQRAVKA